jgi:AbrB family looped-hinge helix DNA binding protein
MVIKLSARGQVLIPQAIRKAMRLQPGATFNIRREGNAIVLEPVDHIAPIDALYGKYEQVDLLSNLEMQHQREVAAKRQND